MMKENISYLKNVLGVKHIPKTRGKKSKKPSSFLSQKLDGKSLEEISEVVASCFDCKLCETRNKTVFASGLSKARIMFIGEAPGADEDEQGLPFVGRAGKLLTKMIEAMGIERKDVYIANVIKCRPPENRRPDKSEVEACEGYLFKQIELVKPEVMVALGATAMETLLKGDEKIGETRGKLLDFRGRKLLVTYHPAYLLRNPPAKKFVWEDLKVAMNHLGLKAKPLS